MLKFICIAGFFWGFLLFSYPVFLIEWIIGKFDKKAKDFSCLRIVQRAFKAAFKLTGGEATFIGEENVPDVPVLFVANHRSYFDILLTYTRHKNLTGYIAKKEMEKIPSLSTWMRLLYCLFMDRDDVRDGLKTILKAIEQIKNGISIFVFPEGHRNRGEELTMLPFKEGAFKIATKSGCPIIPVAINNSFAVFEKQHPRIKKAHVVIEYGKPIYPDALEGDAKKHPGAYVQGVIQNMLNKNAGLV